MIAQKPPVIAVDTNVLIDRADGNETVIDCLSTILKRHPKALLIVPPTVIGELADIYDNGKTIKAKGLAYTALQKLKSAWGLNPIDCVPVGHGIVEETARKIRAQGLLPEEEINDSLIIAESALANATLLVSNDRHMRDIDQSKLRKILVECDLSPLIIFSPWKIVKDHFKAQH